MDAETNQEKLKRALFFCQMFNYGFGRAGILAIHDPIAEGFITFAGAHLLFTMFIVDKNEKPIGGFIYPVLKEVGKEELCGEIIRILREPVAETTFEDYLRKWRNKLATHGTLSPTSLPENIRTVLLTNSSDDKLLELLDKLRMAVSNLTSSLQRELNAHNPAS